MNLPTQLDILEKRLRQRDCEHEWKFIGFNQYGYHQPIKNQLYFEYNMSSTYTCFKCDKTEERYKRGI